MCLHKRAMWTEPHVSVTVSDTGIASAVDRAAAANTPRVERQSISLWVIA